MGEGIVLFGIFSQQSRERSTLFVISQSELCLLENQAFNWPYLEIIIINNVNIGF